MTTLRCFLHQEKRHGMDSLAANKVGHFLIAFHEECYVEYGCAAGQELTMGPTAVPQHLQLADALLLS
jgi:hypothetical protein